MPEGGTAEEDCAPFPEPKTTICFFDVVRPPADERRRRARHRARPRRVTRTLFGTTVVA